MDSIQVVKDKIFSFLALEPEMKVAIVCDNDEDGVTSAVQSKLFLEINGCEVTVFFFDHNTHESSFKNTFMREKYARTFFLDLNEAFISEALMDIAPNTGNILIIDHHQEQELKNALFPVLKIKPWDFSKKEPSHYPTTKMVYDLLGGIDWICAIGVIADFAFKEWADFLGEVKKRHSLSEKELNDLVGLCACVVAFHRKRVPDLFELLCSAKSPRDLFRSWCLDLKNDFDKALEDEKKRFYKEAVYVEDVGLYFFETKPNFRSKLSNEISKEIGDKLIVIYEDQGLTFGASFRRSDYKIDCGKLAEFASREAKHGKGGGHIPAAAATFPRTYLMRFKEKVLFYLREKLSQKKASKAKTKAKSSSKKVSKKVKKK